MELRLSRFSLNVQRAAALLLLLVFLSGCYSSKTIISTKKEINDLLATQQGTFAVAFKDLTTGKKLLIGERGVFPTASTMKTPVMIEVYKQAAENKLSLTESVIVKNEFPSLVDGSPFSVDPNGDSDQDLYTRIGQKRSLADLVYAMITISSNLATNLVLEKVGARNVTHTMRELGAKDIQVLRGVEDPLAFKQGLNNTTTAFDLMIIFQKIAAGQAVSPEASKAMTAILLDQKFAEVIPAKLPKEVKVAHKTGNYTGVRHDSGIVILPDGRMYVLVILSKDLVDDKAATAAMAAVSEVIYRRLMSAR